MLNAIFRPLEKWPGEATRNRIQSPFKADYTNTLNLLEYELDKLRATNIVIQAQARRDQIRNDGWLKSDAALAGPAVIVNFTRGGEEYSYPCDRFKDWRDNVRAIALALEALRKIDRYGVTKRGEQYQGFKALPPGAPPPKQELTPKEAAEMINAAFPGVSADVILTSRTWFVMALKEARKLTHPDATGSHEEFVAIEEAGDVLAKYFDAQAAKAGGAQ